ncbi:hypothetical protein GOP47_0012786 [Adiantum capillus-veneris]|uniref:Homeobox domain-containing protein n=1 Tax=Adiantum capillus-veneris TaxID=13818 RepID=A0A9D4URQ7_ADICA|nr:hypothetical protein GOP47_0012786 [Adiantum capillus-veneris]
MTATKFLSLYSTSTSSLALSLDILTAFVYSVTCRLKVYLKIDDSVRTIILGMPSKPFLAKGILLSETTNGMTYLPTFTMSSNCARVRWEEDEVATLHQLSFLHEALPDIEVVCMFQAKHRHTLHITQVVKCKLSRLKNEKGLVTGAQIRRTHARLSKAIKRYNISIKDKPITPCEKCGRLVFRRQITRQLLPSLAESTSTKRRCYADVYICNQCKKHLASDSNRLWILQETGFNPALPFESDLNPIEARLVSIRIPFAKIRELTYDANVVLLFHDCMWVEKESYLQLLMVWRKQFLPATMDALATLAGMQKSFRDMTGVALNLEEAASADEEMEDLSCADCVSDMDRSICDIDQALLEHVRLELKQKLKEGYKESIIAMQKEILRKRQAGKLPGDITALKTWWDIHSKWPYPTEAEKRKLVEETGLEMRQVNNWFINHRKRNWNDRSPASTSSNSTPSREGFPPSRNPEN